MASFGERLLRTARLEAAAYEEVERDEQATGQALAVVVLSSLAAGVGIGAGPGGLLWGVLSSLVGWYLWALLTYWIGTRWLPEPETRSSHRELLRVVGFASGPGLIRVLGVVPPLRGLVFLVAAVWMLVAGVIAVRQALDYRGTGRAVLVVVIGWVIQWLVMAAILFLLRRPAG
ncbi:MAG TPA: YIP1 family protein [Calidithermus sp.]|jgi:hypothetical protein|nr:YIP1 family protein [Calidithermus sp.]